MYKFWAKIILIPVFCCLLSVSGCSKGYQKVQLSSEPQGAIVYLEEEKIGTTPFEIEIKERQGDYNIYEFHAVKEDFLPNRKAFKEEFYYENVTDAVPESLHFILTKREKHKIEVTSTPVGAEIMFDGVVYGETPCTLLINQSNKYPAVFKIFANMKGYKMAAETVKEVASEKHKGVFEAPDSIHFVLDKQK